MTSERETRFSRNLTTDSLSMDGRKKITKQLRVQSFFLDFPEKNFAWESAVFLCYFDVSRLLRHLPGNFFTFLAADWRRMASVLFCVGEEGGGVFFGGGDFAAEHAGEFFDALFGF